LASSVVGFWKLPKMLLVWSWVGVPSRPFHSLQITWQAWQPMHLVVSISLA
jgi:hypothetical protein